MITKLIQNFRLFFLFLIRCKNCFGKRLPAGQIHQCGIVGVFYNGRAVWEEAGEWFHVRPFLRWQVPAYMQCYQKVEYFQEGLAWVQEKGGKWKTIDIHGRDAKR